MKQLLTSFGIDRAVAYTLIGRVWQVMAGLITLWMVARYLTPAEQGFYYTFASVLAAQVFFELGLGYVILQFASHERANLHWTMDGLLEGEIVSMDRLRSLFKFALRWYGVVALLVLVVMLPSGWKFFSLKQTGEAMNVSWQTAWIELVASTAITILINPIYALLEGCGLVVEVARVRIFQNLVGSIAVWLVLAKDGGLQAAPAMSISLALVGIVWLAHSKRYFLRDMLFVPLQHGKRIAWMTEIWPLQWKIAISWISGYFVFQLINPVLFAYRGPVEAGQMGMSITISTAMVSLPMAWISTKVPRFGMLIAKQKFVELDTLFFRAFWQSLGLVLGLAIILSIGDFILHQYEMKFSARILAPVPFMLLLGATVLNYVTFAQAAYLRAHKQEPFLLTSVLHGILVGICTVILAQDFGSTGIVTAYCVIGLLLVLLGTWIFQVKRQEWHYTHIIGRQ